MSLFNLFKTQKKLELNFIFNSPDHLRYENGVHVSGPHGNAPRALKVEPNITGREGYTVTMYNTDGQYTVQMAPKQMKIVSQDTSKVILKGYGVDAMGSSFADYGLTIFYNNEIISKCILHMHDRKVDIHYLKTNEAQKKDNGIEEINQFLIQFKAFPREKKYDLAGKTDELNNKGVDYYEAGDKEKAILYYKKALEIYPINDDALKNLIVCYRDTNELNKMVEAQKKLEHLKKLGL
jgi:tetratricopeptide (TPR) repeat protein